MANHLVLPRKPGIPRIVSPLIGIEIGATKLRELEHQFESKAAELREVSVYLTTSIVVVGAIL
jgi:hypothetical protein